MKIAIYFFKVDAGTYIVRADCLFRVSRRDHINKEYWFKASEAAVHHKKYVPNEKKKLISSLAE